MKASPADGLWHIVRGPPLCRSLGDRWTLQAGPHDRRLSVMVQTMFVGALFRTSTAGRRRRVSVALPLQSEAEHGLQIIFGV